MSGFRKIFVVIMALAIGLHAKPQANPEYREARRNGALAKIVLEVKEDDGTPVENAKINVLMGMNFREKAYFISGLTDTNGVFVIDGKTTGNEIEIEATKDGYYRSFKRLSLSKTGNVAMVAEGKWQPYGDSLNILLRKILNPKKMIMPTNVYFDGVFQSTNTVIGFDMMAGDWVKPYGKGNISDFNIAFSSDGKKPWESKFSELIMTFPYPSGGAYEKPIQDSSEFRGVYFAETNSNFTCHFKLTNMVVDGRRIKAQLGKKSLLVVRSRCLVDENGHVISAHYSTIDFLSFSTSVDFAGTIRMGYHFNPTPNSINLEWSSKSNITTQP